MSKFYTQIAFFLLSISLYVNNKTLAADPAPIKAASPKLTCHRPTPEEIYEKNKHLLCTDPEEIKEAEKYMNEAVKRLEDHAISKDGYMFLGKRSNMFLYRKKHEGRTNVEKIIYSVDDPNKYNGIINEIWDPDHDSPFNNGSVKIARVYNPNLVMIQQRYEKDFWGRQKYFYALATKVEISKDITIIAMASGNINDHHPSKKEYKNPIIGEKNLFKTDINSDDDIQKGKLRKTFVNIAGYLIKKKYDSYIDITFVGSINGHSCI
ncbi:Acidic phosphoprotein precursor PCEMA1, putative [Plasmodium chabaudi adami]|uniref:Acidic phosphoprotein PCEMA1, putative n=1 Tax=Plasmodium chabaudi adami TaxID=5826 RepID=A0A1C6WTS1_PLACE|nr:Acidic phosphoprotein precursor PCEMA1, putative [Plasmodium chabaudi adami]